MLVGIDSVELKKVKNLLLNTEHLQKKFTEVEIKYINSATNQTMQLAHLAGMFCAKEAFLKALKMGIGGGIKLVDIQVNHDKNGAPYISLLNESQGVFKNYNKQEILLSITHTNSVATAICIIN